MGGHEEGVSGRETETKSIVVIAAEENGRSIGRIRLRRVLDVSAASLIPFVEEVVRPGVGRSSERTGGTVLVTCFHRTGSSRVPPT